LSPTHTAADFLAFMRKVVRAYPGAHLHVILDNSSAHGTPEVRAWLAQHPHVHFHYTPTSASWLNQVEGFFGILGKQSLRLTDFPSTRALRDHHGAYMRAWNRNPPPCAWTKPAAAIIRSHRRMLERISTAVHYTPTSASWLNQVEGFFGILGKQSLSVTDFHSKTALRDHLTAYMRAWKKNPTPFAWTKPAAAIIRSHRRMLERISTAVH